MLKRLALILICAVPLSAFCQEASSNKYQPGTIIAVQPHEDESTKSDSTARYDVSVKVGDTVYIVLYTPPKGANTVEYSPGRQVLVLVGNDSLTFNNKVFGKTEAPILRRETLPSKPGLDWSKAPSQYFTMKQKNLASTLGLSEDQQARIKPIAEQEAGEASQFLGNPVISRKEQLKRWEKLVQSSDEKIKPFLSQTQVKSLQALRKEQKQELKELIADQKRP